MLKKVRIKLVTDRTEMSGSLFEGGVREKKAAKPERMEMIVQGRYYDDGVRVSIGYTESDATGMEGSNTTISYQKNEPELITMIRSHSASSTSRSSPTKTTAVPCSFCLLSRL